METFLLEGHPFIALCDLIKHQGWADCGGAAKALIADGLVEVNGQVETRKRCKIVAGQVIKRLFEQPFKFQQFVRPLFLIEHHTFEPMMANE